MKPIRFPGFQRGGAVVEAAILVIPLLVIALGIAEGGWAFAQYNTVAKSTRNAARYLSTVAAGNADGQHETAKCIAVYGRPVCGGTRLVPRLDTSNVVVCDASTDGRPDCAKHGGVVADGEGGPVMNMVSVSVVGFAPQPFLEYTMPSIRFGPISTTMRQAR